MREETKVIAKLFNGKTYELGTVIIPKNCGAFTVSIPKFQMVSDDQKVFLLAYRLVDMDTFALVFEVDTEDGDAFTFFFKSEDIGDCDVVLNADSDAMKKFDKYVATFG